MPLGLLAQRVTYALDSFPLVAVPIVIFVGNLMNLAGVTERISAHQSVEHDDVNVMYIGAQIVGPWLAHDLVEAYLKAEFSTDEDFRRRVEKLHRVDDAR